MSDCVFCKIAAGEIPGKKLYEDDDILAFHDINPVAPVHVLLIPKKHIASGAADLTEEHSAVIGHIFAVAANIARELDIADGFQIITNNGEKVGQTVAHLHFHLLGGGDFRLKLG